MSPTEGADDKKKRMKKSRIVFKYEFSKNNSLLINVTELF
jgi:hypothetical protein